jgi:hypothetical protein
MFNELLGEVNAAKKKQVNAEKNVNVNVNTQQNTAKQSKKEVD